jgi:hypothetical protein
MVRMKAMTRISKVVTIAATVVGAGVGGALVKNWLYIDPREVAAKEAVDMLRRNGLPRKVDEFTTLVSVDQHKATIMHTYRLEQDLSRADKSLVIERVKRRVTQIACNSPMKKSINQGIGFRYTYFDGNMSYVGNFDILRSDCKA